MTGPLEREFAHTEERLQSLARWLGRNGVLLPHGQDLDALEDLSAIRAALSSIERHVQDMETAREWYRDHRSDGFYDEQMWGDPFAISPQLRAALSAREKGEE